MSGDSDGDSGGDTGDARYEDAFQPARLLARSAEDLQVISALLQDAALAPKDVAWDRGARRFALMANRFRWERPELKERVRAVLHFEDVVAVRARGVAPDGSGDPIAILAVIFEPSEAPAGRIRLACAGDAEWLIDVEALGAVMTDMSKPWPAGATPKHFGV